jgi:hypothetical protein
MAELPVACFGSLYTVSQCRAELPWELLAAGQTWEQKLVIAQGLAREALLKYVPRLELDEEQADFVLFQIGQWVELNGPALEASMATTEQDTLPEQIQLRLGPDQAKSFVLAVYVAAVKGMGPWKSGAVAELVRAGKLREQEMVSDVIDRIQVFLSIVKLERRGELAQIFTGPPESLGFVQIFGTTAGKVVLTALVVTLVATAAVLLVYRYSAERLRLNNKIMADICDWAMEQGREDIVKACVEAAREAQTKSPFEEAAKVLATGAVIVMVVAYALPRLLKRKKKKD